MDDHDTMHNHNFPNADHCIDRTVDIFFIPLARICGFKFAGIYTREQAYNTLNTETFQQIREQCKSDPKGSVKDGILTLRWRLRVSQNWRTSLFHLDHEQDAPLIFGGRNRQTILQCVKRTTSGGCFPTSTTEVKDEESERQAAERQRLEIARQKLDNQKKAQEQVQKYYNQSNQQGQQPNAGAGNPPNTN